MPLTILPRLGLPTEIEPVWIVTKGKAAVAFEDSRNGLLSALGAGLRVVVTPSIYTGDEDFSGAACVLPDLRAGSLPGRLGLPA